MSRDKPGHCRDMPGQSRLRFEGWTGTHPLRGVPMSHPPRLSGRLIHLSESETTGPSYRGAVEGTLSRKISIGIQK
jgi:hypothetical protein